MKILTLDEVKKKGFDYEIFDNGDYSYMDDVGMEYLIRNNKLIATSSYGFESYLDGWYLYYSEKNGETICHLMDENSNELLIAIDINRNAKKAGKEEEFSISSDYCSTNLSKEEIIKYAKERKKITSVKALTLEEIKNLGYVYTKFNNGDYKYQDKKGIEYLIRDKTTIAIGRDIESHPNGWYQYKFKRFKDNCDFNRLLDKHHHIIAESERIVVSGDDYWDDEDLEKFEACELR